MKRVFAVDPGKVTGLVVVNAPVDVGAEIEAFEGDPGAILEYVDEHLTTLVDEVVCESFVPRPGVRTWQPDALETIGALRYICRGRCPFELQSPADAKIFSTNAKLARVGWRVPTPGGHKDDAARHALLYVSRKQLITREFALALAGGA